MYNDNKYFSYKGKCIFSCITQCIMTVFISLIHESVFLIIQGDV